MDKFRAFHGANPLCNCEKIWVYYKILFLKCQLCYLPFFEKNSILIVKGGITMQAVICCLNSKYIHSSLAPWCLLAGVRAYAENDIVASVVEGTINEPPENVLNRIAERHPDVVGFCCYIWNITAVKALIERLRRLLPQVTIVVGGPEVSYCAQEVLHTCPAVDFVISGEGEKPFALLLSALHRKTDIADIPGISYRQGKGMVVGTSYVTNELPPSPYVPEYFEALGGRIAYLETSRGCPFSCAFCLSGRCGSVRYYPGERAEQELLLLANSGAKTIKLVDRTFNANRERALGLLRFILAHYGEEIPTDVCFHFEIGGDLLDEETITVLSEAPAGLFQLEIGIQSFYEPTLSAICRKTDTKRLENNIRKLLACDTVSVHIDLIAGLPKETAEIFAESFNRAYNLQPHMLQLGFLKLLYGAPMREKRKDYPCTFSPVAPYEVISTPWITAEELLHLHCVEEVLERLYNSGRFRRTLRYLQKVTNDTPFALFSRLATCLPGGSPSLDAYTEALYAACCAWDTVDRKALRDAMVSDRLATNPSGILPACLQQNEEQRKRHKRLMETDSRFRRPDNVKRGTAWVDNALVYADYQTPHPVTGEYRLHRFTEQSLTRNTRFLLFDLDGTLTDPAEGITKSVLHALRHFGIEETSKERLLSFIGPPLLETFTREYGLTDEEAWVALRVYREYFADIGLYENAVYAGIPEFLRDAQAAGYELIMATSKPEMYACRLMRHFGLTSYFACIAGSDMAEKRADKAAVILSALSRAGVTDRSETVMIGDRRFDIEGAKAFSMPSVGVLYGYGNREELVNAGADRLAETVEDLRRIFL